MDPAQGRTQGNLGLALGFCTLKDRRLFWVLYLGSCTRPNLGPAPAGSKAIWVLHRTGLLARRSGLQTLPRGFADLRLAGCSQAHGSAPSAQGWANPVPSVCMIGPRPALALGSCSPTPRPDSPSARCPQPRGHALSQVLGACRLQPHHASTTQCNLQ